MMLLIMNLSEISETSKRRRKHTKRTAFSDSDLYLEPDLSRDDLVKLLTEKELLFLKQEELEKMKDKVLMTFADMENVKDRTRRESEYAKKFAIQVCLFVIKFCDILSGGTVSYSPLMSIIIDRELQLYRRILRKAFWMWQTIWEGHLLLQKRAFQNASSDTSGDVQQLKILLEGVEMTEKQLSEVFKKFGLENTILHMRNSIPTDTTLCFKCPVPQNQLTMLQLFLRQVIYFMTEL